MDVKTLDAKKKIPKEMVDSGESEKNFFVTHQTVEPKDGSHLSIVSLFCSLLLLLKDLHTRIQKNNQLFLVGLGRCSFCSPGTLRTVDRKAVAQHSLFFKCLKRAPGRLFSPAWSPASEGMTSKSLRRNTSSPLSRCK